MTDKRYNGWSNYETWAVKLWMDNDQSEYERLMEKFSQQAYDSWRDVTRNSWDNCESIGQFILASHKSGERASVQIGTV